MAARGMAQVAVRSALIVVAVFSGLVPVHAEVHPASPPYQLGFLHVGAAAGPAGLPQVVDAAGRTVLLRGVNVNGLEDYFQASATPLAAPYPTAPGPYAGGACPARNKAVESVALCAIDFPQMRALGYDSIRLAVSWSSLEPAPGHIDTGYIDRIGQVVGWAKQNGIYSIIDMHQDAWSKFIYTPAGESCPPPFANVGGFHEADGAPAWASTHVTPACALVGVREFDAAVQEDFQRLWSDAAGPDGVGLQEHYASVVLALARRFHADPAVAGYELINEPSPGFVPPLAMDPIELFPFYAKVVKAVTDAVPGFQQLVFIEPDTLRDVTDQSLMLTPWSVFSSYPNAVYAPHVYTRVFTPDAQLGGRLGTPAFLPMNEGYDSAVRDARALGLPLWVGEFGNDVAEDDVVLRAHYANQDADIIGSSLWVWKQDDFSVYHGPFGDGVPFPSRVKFTSRAYPLFTAGSLGSLAYNPDSGGFDLRATSAAVPAGDQAHATVLFVPAVSRGAVIATGAVVDTTDVPGGRIAFVYPSGGEYHVSLAAGSGQPSGGAAGVGAAAALPGAPNTSAAVGARLATAAFAAVLIAAAAGVGRRRHGS